jgi:hypothetical protein
MASWLLTAQLTSGTLALASTDRPWWNGTNFGDQITVNSYQDSTHVSDSSDVHRCTSVHVNNTKFLTNSTVSINGAGSSALPVPTAKCSWKFTFTDASAISVASAKFYAYDGANDNNPVADTHIKAAEGGVSTAWIDANGSGNALNLADQSSATSHDFFVALSVAPTSQGNKTGKFKISLSYV